MQGGPDVWAGVSASDMLATALGVAVGGADLAVAAAVGQHERNGNRLKAGGAGADEEEAAARHAALTREVLLMQARGVRHERKDSADDSAAHLLDQTCHGKRLLALLLAADDAAGPAGRAEAPVPWVEVAAAAKPFVFRLVRRFERDLITTLAPLGADSEVGAAAETTTPRTCSLSTLRAPAHAMLRALGCSPSQSVSPPAVSRLHCSCLADLGSVVADTLATLVIPDAPGPAIAWLGTVVGKALEREGIGSVMTITTAPAATDEASRRCVLERCAAIAAMALTHVLPASSASSHDAGLVAQSFAASDVEHAAYVAGDTKRLQRSRELFL